MHVVFFNRSFYPDGAATGQLLTDLAEDLVRQHGWRVTVVTGVPLAPSRPALPSLGGWLVGREDYNGVAIRRARGTRFDKRRFAGRAANYLSYFLTACWAGLRVDRPDVVVAMTDPPIIGLAAWLAATRAGAPLVMVYQDLFPGHRAPRRFSQRHHRPGPAAGQSLSLPPRVPDRRARRNHEATAD